jgi:uncharacterized RDD family membrane protein YckC
MSVIQENILSDIIEQPKPTSIGKRIAASLIDGLILLVIFVILGKLFGEQFETTTYTTTVTSASASADPTTSREVEMSSGFHLSGWPMLGFMVCWFFLIPFMEGMTGQTIGKKALGIRTIRQDGAPSTVGTSFVRHLFDGIDFFLLIGIIVAASNPKRTRIGDLVAKTYVVDKVIGY